MLLTALTSAVSAGFQTDQEIVEECIQEIAKGNKQYLTQLYKQTDTAVYGFALSIVKNPFDAQDIMQNAYIKIYENAFRYTAKGKPMAWIFTIVKNLCFMKLRENQKTMQVEEQDWATFYIENEKLSVEEKILLKTAMELLSDQERQIIMLHAVSGFKHKEIAALLEMPLPTALSKYNRAIKKLQNFFKEE